VTSERSSYGLLVSAMGAIVLAVALFLPWYAAATPAHRLLPAAHRTSALSGWSTLGGIGPAVLVLAALALLDTLTPLARRASVVPAGAGGAVVLLGLLACALVAFRMAQPPVDAAVSLRAGAWLALLGALTVSLGGMWPRALPALEPGEAVGPGIFSTLTG